MTEGPSRGLFVVIANGIFGIFISTRYIVFDENSAFQTGGW